MLLPAFVVCRQGAERERKLVSKRVLLGPNDELNRREATKEDYRLARLNRVMSGVTSMVSAESLRSDV